MWRYTSFFFTSSINGCIHLGGSPSKFSVTWSQECFWIPATLILVTHRVLYPSTGVSQGGNLRPLLLSFSFHLDFEITLVTDADNKCINLWWALPHAHCINSGENVLLFLSEIEFVIQFHRAVGLSFSDSGMIYFQDKIFLGSKLFNLSYPEYLGYICVCGHMHACLSACMSACVCQIYRL